MPACADTNGHTNGHTPDKPCGALRHAARLTQHDCDRTAAELNCRPRKRLGYRTPEECYVR